MFSYEDVINFWKKKKVTSGAELSEILSSYCINFAYNSGKLENDSVTYNDTREIFKHNGVVSYTGDLKTLFELWNAKVANEFMYQSFDKNRDIDECFVKKIHYLLTANTYDERRWQLGERPGEYKYHDYVTGREEVGVLPEDVHDEITELLEELKDIPDDKALTAAAYFHVKFENIHPFADGNGRCGRLLMNYFLMMHGHPPVIIFEEDRKDYYYALEQWDTRQELEVFKMFLKQQVTKTWEKRLDREVAK